MKRSSIFVCCLLFALTAMSQKAILSFDKKTHDFGKVKEQDGKITYVFEFTNKGTAPLVVSNAKPSCGCTTPSWTKEPVEAGKKGTITVTYNPAGRPGAFTKTITITSNSENETDYLTITGEVIPDPSAQKAPVSPGQKSYLTTMGDLQLTAKGGTFGNIAKGSTATLDLDVKNNGKQDIAISFDNVPSHITASSKPETLKPGQEGKLSFVLDSKKCTTWGPSADNPYVVVNGKGAKLESNKLNLIKYIKEDFSKMSKDQKISAPIADVQPNKLALGTIKAGAKKVGKVKITNKGQNNLEIRSITNSNPELSIKAPKGPIATGKSTELIVEVDTKGQKEGDFKKVISLQVNDPENSVPSVEVSWTVTK
jgi:Protein of unknown function (DUF1573)